MRKNAILAFGMVAALALAIPLQARAIVIVNGFEGAGITAQGKTVVISTARLGGATKGIIIDNSKVVSLSCATFVPARGPTGAPKPTGGGTLYANGKAGSKWYRFKAVDAGLGLGADEIGIVVVGGKPQGDLCGVAADRTQRLKAGQFVAYWNPDN